MPNGWLQSERHSWLRYSNQPFPVSTSLTSGIRMNKPVPTALVVLHAFGRYSRGDLITDPASIQAILNGGNSALVLVPAMPPVASTSSPVTEH